MERKRYLELCQKVAVLPDGEMYIKQNVPDELKVVHKGCVYYPLQRIAGFNSEGKLVLYARLHSIKDNSVTECLLENVEELVKDV